MSPREIASGYIRRGWCPVPVPFKAKGPVIPAWNELRLTLENVEGFFNGQPANIGVILGPPSGGLTDVDLDSREAVALADSFLPPTAACFGRRSKPRSHWLYRTKLSESEDIAVVPFKDPTDGAMLVEIRIGGETGAQTVFPGSVHLTGSRCRSCRYWRRGP